MPDPVTPLRVAILGTGAIGGWLAGGLAEAGCAVSLLARGPTLDALRREGLRLREGGRSTRHALPASDDPASLGEQDVVIVAVKAQTLPAALPGLLPLLGPGTRVMTAMNGLPWWFFQDVPGPLAGHVPEAVDPGGRIAAAIPAARVIGAVVHAAARVVEPGLIEVVKADRLPLGLPAGPPDQACAALVAAFRRGGINAAASADIRAETWSKLWGNASFNPISVLTGGSSLQMLDEPGVHAAILAVMAEMAELGRAAGLPDLGAAEERLAVARRLGDFRTSMLQDAEAGRALELEPILGVLEGMADRLGLAVPVIRMVLGMTRLRAAGLPGR